MEIEVNSESLASGYAGLIFGREAVKNPRA